MKELAKTLVDVSEIGKKLDQLAEYQARHFTLTSQRQALIDEIMTAEIREKLAQIDGEFLAASGILGANITNLETEIKQDVIKHGVSVKGTFLQAIWNKGRISWDTRALDGFAVANPELNAFRKEGEPSVSIRSAK